MACTPSYIHLKRCWLAKGIALGEAGEQQMLWLGDGVTAISALVIRDDISSAATAQARRESDGRISARLIAIANALEGMDRAMAARTAGMDRQTLRDWVHRYNAEGIAGLCDRPKPGRMPKLSEGQRASLKAIVLAGPDPAAHQVGRWRDRRSVPLCRGALGGQLQRDRDAAPVMVA